MIARWNDASADVLAETERRGEVQDAMDRLPDEFRSVIVLKDIEGMESKAIAASLGISDALVRQRLHRARQAMTRLLAGVMEATP